MAAFLTFAFRVIRRGPEASPDHAEASGSLKNALRPQVMDSPTAAAMLGR
jgi:cytochrome d ubiquinol oxidase subunit I